MGQGQVAQVLVLAVLEGGADAFPEGEGAALVREEAGAGEDALFRLQVGVGEE